MSSNNPGGGGDLMDLMSAPVAVPPPQQPSTGGGLLSGQGILGGRFQKGKNRPATLQIPKDTLNITTITPAATAANPTPKSTNSSAPKSSKGPISYAQLSKRLEELVAGVDQKNNQKQLVESVFPKLAVYSSVNPALAPVLLKLLQTSENRTLLRYAYYYLGRILAESPDATGGTPGGTGGGGIPTPDWDMLVVTEEKGLKRMDVLPKIVEQLGAEARSGGDGTGEKPANHARRMAALKSLVCAPATPELRGNVQSVVMSILEKVSDMGKVKRKKGIFGRHSVDKDQAVRSNLQYGGLSAMRRLPLDHGNPVVVTRAVQGLNCADPVGVRHALALLSQLAVVNPVAMGMALSPQGAGGSLVDSLGVPDTLGRAYLARLCSTLVLCPQLSSRPDITSGAKNILFQLMLDQSEKVCLEAIAGVAGSFGGEGTLDQRAAGWALLCSASMEVQTPTAAAAAKGAAPPPPPPQEDKNIDILKVAVQRIDLILSRSQSRPALHAAVRVVSELGKARAAANTVMGSARSSIVDQREDDTAAISRLMGNDAASLAGSAVDRPPLPRGRREHEINLLLGVLMEAVRTVVACECVYVRAMALKAMIWMQGPDEAAEELKASIAGELSDASWPTSLLNDLLLTLHARFKATPSMAITLLDVAGLFVTLVPSKLDTDVLQRLWKHCLVGCGPEGKRTALEAVSVVLDLPPPAPPGSSVNGLTTRSSTSDPRSAIALQRLVLAAVWFLGENANYAAAEYGWEPGPPTAALMMMEGSTLVTAASSRNPALAAALSRLQRCALSSSWEVRVVAIQALMTVALRSGEPYRLQVYEFLHKLVYGATKERVREAGDGEAQLGAKAGSWAGGSGEDPGATGTGLASVIGPMIKMLDEMYEGEEKMLKDVREHKNKSVDWTDEEIKKVGEDHSRLLSLVSLFCYVPRSKYLPLGPASAPILSLYNEKFGAPVPSSLHDPAMAAGIADLLNFTGGGTDFNSVATPTAAAAAGRHSPGMSSANVDYSALDWSSTPPGMDIVNDFLGSEAGDDEAPEEGTAPQIVPAVNYEDLFASSLLEASDDESERTSAWYNTKSDTDSSSNNSPRSPQGIAAVTQFTAEQAAALFDSPADDPLTRWESSYNTGQSSAMNKRSTLTADTDSPKSSSPMFRAFGSRSSRNSVGKDTDSPKGGSPILKALRTRTSRGDSSSYSRPSSIGGDTSARRILDPGFFSSWGKDSGASTAERGATTPTSTSTTHVGARTPRASASAPSGGAASLGRATALYDFSAGGDDEMSLGAGEELEIMYEVDGWYMVKKKYPGPDGKLSGLVPVLYVNNVK